MFTPNLTTVQNSSLRTLPSPDDSDRVYMLNYKWMIELVTVIGKALFLLFLVILLALSLVTWVWIVSFRAGWQTCHWLLNSGKERTNEQISFGLLYGLIILLISPVVLVYEWSQKQRQRYLPTWMQPSINIPLRQIIEDRLGIQLGDEFPGIAPAQAPQSQSLDDK
jgi:hypothetical protein